MNEYNDFLMCNDKQFENQLYDYSSAFSCYSQNGQSPPVTQPPFSASQNFPKIRLRPKAQIANAHHEKAVTVINEILPLLKLLEKALTEIALLLKN